LVIVGNASWSGELIGSPRFETVHSTSSFGRDVQAEVIRVTRHKDKQAG